MKRANLKIRKPFYSAWQKYNWVNEYGQSVGIGINCKLLWQADIIELEYDGGFYELETKKIDEIAKKYKSYYYLPQGVVLKVIPILAFRPIINKKN